MTDDLAFLDATAQAELIRRGDVSPAELVEAAIERIERLNPQLNAVIHPRFEAARAEAAHTDAIPGGAFRGVPMVIKDLLCAVEGEPLHEGMRLLKDAGHLSDHTQYLAEKFRAAGFITVGRTNTPELGILPTTEPEAYGPTGNPWNIGHSTGGSSGGSAAAVASGMVPVGHANDGGGSIRIPASECGLVGLKPSRGRTSLGPEYGDLMCGLVCEGVVTRSVRDTAAVLDAIQGPMPGDPYTAPPPARPYTSELTAAPARLRIGLQTAAPGAMAITHADCVAAAEGTAKLLEELGHSVEVAELDALADAEYTSRFLTFWSAGIANDLEHFGRKVGRQVQEGDVEVLTWALAEMARATTAAQFLAAQEWLQRNTREVAAFWADGGFDLLLTPTIAEPPPELGQFASPPDNPLQGIFRAAGLVPFTPPFNVTGQPGISLPLHWNDAGLPIGSQLVAAYGREDLLIRVAAQLEEAQPWADRRPPVSA